MCLRACATQSAVPEAQERWTRPLLASAQALLTRYLASPSASALRAGGEAVAVVLHCVGELALLALAASSGQGIADAAPAAEAAAGEAGLLRPAPVSVPPHLVTCLQALLGRHVTVSAPLHGSAAAAAALPSSSSSATATLPLPDAVRAHAVLCLGKLCLRDGGLAKRYVAVFVRDLQAGGAAVAAPPAVRNNCLLVLGDLCVRYTSVVDRHLPALAACLADPHPLLRRHGVQLLGRLLASEYVKLRAPLFYRLAAALADADEGVRRLAQAALSGVLAPRARGALSAHFVSLAVVLTGCAALPGFAHIASSAAAEAGAAATAADDEGEEGGASSSSAASSSAAPAAPSSFVLASFLRRQHVYRSLLAALPDEAKLALHGKLASEVLAAPAEGVVALAPGGGRAAGTPAGAAGPSAFPLGSAELLIADALAIMACPEMRAVTAAGASKGGAAAGGGSGGDKSGAGGAAADDADEDAAAAAAEAAEGGESGSAAARLAAAAASAKSRLLARLVSKHVAENVLPVVLGLRQTCAAARSSLSAQVAAYVDVLMTDHGAEIRGACPQSLFCRLLVPAQPVLHRFTSSPPSPSPTSPLQMPSSPTAAPWPSWSSTTGRRSSRSRRRRRHQRTRVQMPSTLPSLQQLRPPCRLARRAVLPLPQQQRVCVAQSVLRWPLPRPARLAPQCPQAALAGLPPPPLPRAVALGPSSRRS